MLRIRLCTELLTLIKKSNKTLLKNIKFNTNSDHLQLVGTDTIHYIKLVRCPVFNFLLSFLVSCFSVNFVANTN